MKTKTTKYLSLFVFSIILHQMYSYGHGLGVQIHTPAIHLNKKSYSYGKHYSYKLTSSGKIIWLPGLKLFYDYHLNKKPFHIKMLRTILGYHKDCMNRSSYIFHAGPRFSLPFYQNFEMTIGFGPTLWIRKTWEIFDFYLADHNIKQSSTFPTYEYRWFLFGDIDIAWKLNDHYQIVYTIVPAIPYLLAGSFGIIYKF